METPTPTPTPTPDLATIDLKRLFIIDPPKRLNELFPALIKYKGLLSERQYKLLNSLPDKHNIWLSPTCRFIMHRVYRSRHVNFFSGKRVNLYYLDDYLNKDNPVCLSFVSALNDWSSLKWNSSDTFLCIKKHPGPDYYDRASLLIIDLKNFKILTQFHGSFIKWTARNNLHYKFYNYAKKRMEYFEFNPITMDHTLIPQPHWVTTTLNRVWELFKFHDISRPKWEPELDYYRHFWTEGHILITNKEIIYKVGKSFKSMPDKLVLKVKTPIYEGYCVDDVFLHNSTLYITYENKRMDLGSFIVSMRIRRQILPQFVALDKATYETIPEDIFPLIWEYT